MGKLCAITYKVIKFKNLIPIQIMRIKFIFCVIWINFYQYELLVWGGASDNILNIRQVNQNNIVYESV